MKRRLDFQNPYTGAWLTRRECLLIWAIMRKIFTAPHHGFRRIWTTYNRPMLDMIFTEIIQEQRETWWVRAEGGYHIPPMFKLDCRRIVEALHETPNPKFCSLKFEVDKVSQVILLSTPSYCINGVNRTLWVDTGTSTLLMHLVGGLRQENLGPPDSSLSTCSHHPSQILLRESSA